jgi:hypothetical protein
MGYENSSETVNETMDRGRPVFLGRKIVIIQCVNCLEVEGSINDEPEIEGNYPPLKISYFNVACHNCEFHPNSSNA